MPENNFLEVYMIDPVIFTIGGLSLRWYGVIVMLGVIAGSLMVERVLKQHGENSEAIWDALVWVLPLGIVGARLWYVINATLGGDTRYANDPAEIFKVWHGGLHIFGGLLVGGATLLYYLNKNKLDVWLFLDAAGPAMLIGQGIGRIANFINQELYGPPTTLPWGIPISAEHRLPQFQDLAKFPVDTTRFHPTFVYEMLWNFAAAGVLLWLARRYGKSLKPGTLFAGWLIAAGVGRTWIELFFRPDQPKIGNSIISYSAVVSALMAIVGAIMLMARYKALNIQAAENWEEEYKLSTQQPALVEESAEMVAEEPVTPRAKRVAKTTVKPTTARKKPVVVDEDTEEAPAPKKKPTARTKKTSE
jgi:phosphatidylglycerol:prolipoprotein diacylglycerol transferase